MVDVFDFYQISDDRVKIWEYYGLAGVGSDFYPLVSSKTSKHELVAHPLMGAYMIVDLINVSKNKAKKKSALHLAEAIALSLETRMELFNEALVFFYHPESNLSSYKFKFYSALTQARYLDALNQLYDQTNSDFLLNILSRIAKSFLILVEKGGVLLQNGFGTFFEEYPTEVPSYVLNGWLTVLNALHLYCIRFENVELKELARLSTSTLCNLLPLYDMPESLNSRYSLSGYIFNKIQFSKPREAEVLRVTIESGGKTISSPTTKSEGYSSLEIISNNRVAGPYFSFKSAATMVAYPKPINVFVELFSEQNQKIVWSVGVARKNLKKVTPSIVGVRELKRLDVDKGKSTIKLEVPWDLAVPFTGSPTSFSKKVNGAYYNVYHYIHIKALTQLSLYSDNNNILKYRDKWLEYTEMWSDEFAETCSDISFGVLSLGPYSSKREFLTKPELNL